MKKFLAGMVLGLTIFFVIFMQINLLNHIPLFGVIPNFCIVLVVGVGLISGMIPGSITGVVCGLITDILFGRAVGVYIFIYAILGIFCGYVNKGFSHDNKMSVAMIVFFTTIVVETISSFFISIVYKAEFSLISSFLVSFIEAIYNGILTLIFYSVISKVCKLVNESKKRYR